MSKKKLGGDPRDKALVFEKKGEAVDVLRGDVYVRTFSAKKHGKGFEKLANDFVAGRPDADKHSIVDSADIPAVKVLYREQAKDENGKPTGAFVDKTRVFKDKREAHFFNNEVHGTIVVAR